MAIDEVDLSSPSYTLTSAVADALSSALDATLLAVDERGDVVSALPMQFRRRVTVGETATLFGSDISGALRAVATVTSSPPRLKLSLRYVTGNSAAPRELLASFRFLRALHKRVRLRMTIGDRPLGEPEKWPTGTDIPGLAELTEFTRSLAFVQAVTGTEFPLPQVPDDDDLRALREAEVLLAGGTVSGRWNDVTLGLSTIDAELLSVVDGAPPFRLEFVAPVLAQIGEHAMPLGEARYLFTTAVIDNFDELVEARRVSGHAGAEAKLVPGFDNTYEVALIAPPEIGVDLQDVRPSVLASSGALDAAKLKPLRRNAFEPAAS